MRALIYSGIVQGFSTPPLLLFILLMTNSRRIMGDKVNSLALNILSGATVLAIFAASIGLMITWFI
jgi:Mn2+/Fe2+ NRAMP family transporter